MCQTVTCSWILITLRIKAKILSTAPGDLALYLLMVIYLHSLCPPRPLLCSSYLECLTNWLDPKGGLAFDISCSWVAFPRILPALPSPCHYWLILKITFVKITQPKAAPSLLLGYRSALFSFILSRNKYLLSTHFVTIKFLPLREMSFQYRGLVNNHHYQVPPPWPSDTEGVEDPWRHYFCWNYEENFQGAHSFLRFYCLFLQRYPHSWRGVEVRHKEHSRKALAPSNLLCTFLSCSHCLLFALVLSFVEWGSPIPFTRSLREWIRKVLDK